MKRAVISAADFAALRRQLPAKSLAALVGRIERGYRAALAVEGFDDAVVVATLNSASQSETERAGLRVIRAWIAYRETDGGPGVQTPAARCELAEERLDP